MFPSLLNARDLGGHPTTDGTVTRPRSRRSGVTAPRSGGSAPSSSACSHSSKRRWPQSRRRAPGRSFSTAWRARTAPASLPRSCSPWHGVVPAAIAADYAASSENVRDVYLSRYPDGDSAGIIESVRCPALGVYNMLDYLDRAGGVHAYLGGIGLGAAQITRLRARLR